MTASEALQKAIDIVEMRLRYNQEQSGDCTRQGDKENELFYANRVFEDHIILNYLKALAKQEGDR